MDTERHDAYARSKVLAIAEVEWVEGGIYIAKRNSGKAMIKNVLALAYEVSWYLEGRSRVLNARGTRASGVSRT